MNMVYNVAGGPHSHFLVEEETRVFARDIHDIDSFVGDRVLTLKLHCPLMHDYDFECT